MWIRTLDGWYVCEIRGVVFVTWVSERDKAHAAQFPEDKITEFVDLVESLTGKKLQAVAPLPENQPTTDQQHESFVDTKVINGEIHYVERRVAEWQPDGTIIMRDPLSRRAFTMGGVELPAGWTWMDGIKE